MAIVNLPPAEQQALLQKFRDAETARIKEETLKRASQEKIQDYKDISFGVLYREDGDTQVARMAHINSLARRVAEIEATVNEFQNGPVKERELVSEIKYVSAVSELQSDEAILVAKKKAV